MAHITDYLENGLEHSNAGKALDARMGKEILKRPSVVIPRLDIQVRKTPTNDISNTVIIKVLSEINAEFMNLNPIIVLMRKHNMKKKRNGEGIIVKHGKNKWVEPGTQWELNMNPGGQTSYLSQQRDFQFGFNGSTWFTPRLISNNSIVMNCDYLMDSFIKNESVGDNFIYSLMSGNQSKKVSNGNVAQSLFGLAIRIDNPKFKGDIIAYPKSTMFEHEPKYIYGEISKILFRLELNGVNLYKSLSVL